MARKPTPVDQPSNPTASEAEPDIDDSIAKNRVVSVVEATSIPAVPKSFRSTDAEHRRKRLRRVAETQKSEAMSALTLLAKRSEQLKSDFGKFAPDGKRAEGLLERLRSIMETRTAAQNLLTYLTELEQIAWSDAILLLEALNKELEHALPHDPSLATTYKDVVTYFAQRSAAVTDGISRAKASTKIDDEDV